LAAQAIEEYLALQEWQVAAIQAGEAQAREGRGASLDEVRARWEARRADATD
jgi:predicted transcriptional regulator